MVISLSAPSPIEQNEFSRYVEVGCGMRVEGSDSFRVVQEIECVLEGKQFSPEQDEIDIPNLASSTFFALVAPSLSGKTQLAFALRRRRPLYFAIGQYYDNAQKIYKCFRWLNQALTKCAAADKDTLDVSDDYESISCASLQLSKSKFLILGLIKALIRNGTTYIDANDNWMKHYIQEKTHKVVPISVPDFLRDAVSQQLHQYVLFLDEFASSESTKFASALVRNLARAVGLKVICAGTNTAATNLIGQSSAEASGIDDKSGWCIVLSKLPTPSPALVERGDEAIGRFKSESISPTLREFLGNQIKVSRGGISISIIECLETIDASVSSNRTLLENILQFVEATIVGRKAGMNSTAAFKARLALCLCNYYEIGSTPSLGTSCVPAPSDDRAQPETELSATSSCVPAPSDDRAQSETEPSATSSCVPAPSEEIVEASSNFCSAFRPKILEKQRKLWNHCDSAPFLHKHYFKMVVPEDSRFERFVFTLVHQREKSTQVEFKYRQHLPVDKSWTPRSFFPRDEVILQLASFRANLAPEIETVVSIIKMQENLTDNQEIEDSPNVDAKTSSGLVLENTAHMSIIESSHLGGDPLLGIEMKPFLEFVFTNLMVSAPSDIPIADDSGLFALVEGLSVPFLNAVDMKWSDQLKSIEGLNLGHYCRHPNADGIDGSFELSSNSNDCQWFDWAVVECKNLGKNVSVSDYVGILEKGWNWSRDNEPSSERPNGTRLHLMFCQKLTEFQEQSGSRKKAIASNWCAFTIRRSGIDGPTIIETAIRKGAGRSDVVGVVFESEIR